ncbi:hypothetical protein IVA87_14295 [Bradyrhizobium sp. 147]|jgi:hypothetical protein|uniref:hypothetical protein n=1 Tax=unclassified Bradyrhizobium TaxID=2631580 RepID=UPI001FFC2759|nr:MULTISPECIES: hypothetical protein [unclassified Bradyrhizobium]MCK1546298.1 hypothetical protein [Bradyrhizobium sp. 179]MCK1680563.1 hypothetical protein [Bradyrhizobium sp. 147]
MQTLAVDIAATFVNDAAALVTGFGRALLRFAMTPIDRVANACDIAGVLTERRATFRMWRANRARARLEGRRFSLLGRLSPFRHLSHLT